jgi:ABC-2 type transport system permease protein
VTSLWESAWVIARRDFVATVFSRTFILFLIAPIFVGAFAITITRSAGDADRNALQPVVAHIADTQTAEAVASARARLVAGTTEYTFPDIRVVQPAEDVAVQAQRLLADEEGGYSAVLSGPLERPVLTGPVRVDEAVGKRLQLVIDEARRTAALEAAGANQRLAPVERVVTEQAAGNLRMWRRTIARGGQVMIFLVTLMLATLLLSNLVEEKSNKVIEVLAAAVPLDAVFLGKLIAMLFISLVGLTVWGGLIGLAWLFVQVVQDWMALPQVGPAVGWPVYLLMMLVYYTTNYMLLGGLFLGIGAQASNIREIQTLSMPITFLQLMVLLLAMTVVGGEMGPLPWLAYILPFSSPLAMIAFAAESPVLWPHLLALAWQALWIVLVVRIAARLFRSTVLKTSSKLSFMQELRFWRA